MYNRFCKIKFFLNKKISKMKKINAFTYENEDGTRVTFVPRAREEEGFQKYSFFIVNNEELTKKLIKEINKKSVKFNDIFYMARVIFEYIRMTNEYNNLQEIFLKKYDTLPEFEVIFESKRVTAILEETNIIFFQEEKIKIPITGQGKTELNAKLKALRKFFRKI